MRILPTDALLVVDVQNDFCPGGALPVGQGYRVVPIINQIATLFEHVIFTRDWHPANHCSFATAAPPEFVDGSWPPHCLEFSPGAEFHGDLHVPSDAPVISKGTDPEQEAYSGFQGTELESLLRNENIRRVFVCGLATDYCVKATALDALALGFEVVLVENACRGVDFPPGSVTEAVAAMRQAGVAVCYSGDFE